MAARYAFDVAGDDARAAAFRRRRLGEEESSEEEEKEEEVAAVRPNAGQKALKKSSRTNVQ